MPRRELWLWFGDSWFHFDRADGIGIAVWWYRRIYRSRKYQGRRMFATAVVKRSLK